MSEFTPQPFNPDIHKRSADILDMSSQSCLLLAEHIASRTDFLRSASSLYSKNLAKSSVSRTKTTVDICEALDSSFHTDIMDRCPLPGTYVDPDQRITGLELAWHLKEETTTYGRFRKTTQSHWVHDEDRPTYLLAVARGLRIPFMRIVPEPIGNCQFIGFEDEIGKIGEVYATKTDASLEEREEALKATWQFLGSISMGDSDSAAQPDIVNMGVVERVHDVLGDSDETTEYIIGDLVSRMASKNFRNRDTYVNWPVENNGSTYPGRLHVVLGEAGNSIELLTEQNIPGSKTARNIPFLPPAIITPNSSSPISFTGINDELHIQQLSLELRDTLLSLPPLIPHPSEVVKNITD